MVSFVVYDLIFLVLFTAFVVIFLYTRKHNLSREGWIFLYRTQLGVKFLDSTAKKFRKILKPLQYLVVVVGYALMLTLIVLVVFSLYQYFQIPTDSQIARVPAVIPLIPYFTDIFGIESFFPRFYFTYFLVAILIVAFVHEASHGILMRFNNLRVKSTGFLFLGPILGAFVEEDKNQLKKSKTFPQLAILAAGVFANVITAVIFGLLLMLFFVSSFMPAGVNYINTYPIALTSTSSVVGQINPAILSANATELIPVTIENQRYYAHPQVIKISVERNLNLTWVYLDSPTLGARMFGSPDPTKQIGVGGAITQINGEKITSQEQFSSLIKSYSPGDEIEVTLIESKTPILSIARPFYEGEQKEYTITLASRNGSAFMGVSLVPKSTNERPTTKILSLLFFTPIKDLSTYYESELGEFGIFVYYLLWWIVLINVFVAIFNMIPGGPFDGGRFFYLTVFALTGNNKKKAEKAYNISVKILLLALAILIAKWLYNVAAGFF